MQTDRNGLLHLLWLFPFTILCLPWRECQLATQHISPVCFAFGVQILMRPPCLSVRMKFHKKCAKRTPSLCQLPKEYGDFFVSQLRRGRFITMLLSTGFIDGPLSWHFSCDRELKRATSLSNGRKPDVNISPARTVGSSRFSNKSSPLKDS